MLVSRCGNGEVVDVSEGDGGFKGVSKGVQYFWPTTPRNVAQVSAERGGKGYDTESDESIRNACRS